MIRNLVIAVVMFNFMMALPVKAGNKKGMQAAGQLCNSMNFSNEKQDCIRIIGNSKFFDPKAVGLCSGLYYSSEKIKCLKTIRNQKFVGTVINTCKEMYFSSDKVSCLANGGKNVKKNKIKFKMQKQKNENNKTRKLVKKAIKNLDKGNVSKARALMDQVLFLLQ